MTGVRGPIEVRFWTKIDKTDDCWLWTAGINKATGYGIVWTGKTMNTAHRVAYELVNGPIPSGLWIDHLCSVRRCVNPAHLEVVTPAENCRRTAQRGRNAEQLKTHCPHGHPYDEANTRRIPSRPNARYCIACEKARGH